jgi:putative ABC transport system permease protein
MRFLHRVDEARLDVMFAIRQLRRSPAFAIVITVTLALGIGANSAMFALVDATLLRPLPFGDPDRLVVIWERTDTSLRERVSPRNLVDWRERNRTFERMAPFIPNVGGMVMSGADGTAETVPRQWVSAGVFDVLGIKATIGRTFLPSDETQRANVVVLSEAFWQMRFNAASSVIGSDIRLDGSPFTVIGVVPKEAQMLGQASLWALRQDLYPSHGTPPGARGAHFAHAIGRLRQGVTPEAAGADLTAVAERLAQEFPKTNRGRGVTVEPMRDAVIGAELRKTSILFLGVVGFVLLICCANVANLLLTRTTVRRRELALRSALGADRRRVIRQLLTESLVLAMAGGLMGMAVGASILRVAPSFVPLELLPAAVTLTFDLRVVAFCAAAALLVGLLFGLAPAWHATEFSAEGVMASNARTVTGAGGRVREWLVAAEIATAVMVLVGAGLLLRTLLVVEGVDRGYRADSLLTMIVDPLGSRYPTDVSELQFYEAVQQAAMAQPGVQSVAWASTLPLGRSYAGRMSFSILGQPPPDESRRPTADYQIVSPSYFQTLDLPVVTGRGFTDRDTRDSIPVCMVNEAFVRRYLQGRSPIGVRLAMRPTTSAPAREREIVGVARQVKGRPDETEDFIQIYVPLAQDTPGDIFMIVRPASGTAAALAPPIRAAFAQIDKDQLVSVRDVMTLEDVARESIARHRFRAALVITFAGLALLLAMVGVFGVLAYSVRQRVRDFGVRRALGATTGNVLGLVARSAAHMILMGGLIGMVLSTVLGQLVESMLFGVAPLDPMTFASVTLVLVFTAIVAAAAPAWHAARINPAVALRSE